MPRFWRTLTRRLIADVPQELSCCEFDCKKPDCARGEWETCPTRLGFEAGLKETGAP